MKLRNALLIISSIIFLSSCTTFTGPKVVYKTVKEPIFIKCKIPFPNPPQLEKPLPNDNYTTLQRKLIYNYGEMEMYIKRLELAIKVCNDNKTEGGSK